MFERLEFLYLPSRDVAADVERFTTGLGGELSFAIEAFGTRVAMVRLGPEPPAILLAGHLAGQEPVLVYRVADLEGAVAELAGRGVELARRFEIPHGPGAELALPGPHGSRCTSSRGRAPPRALLGGATSDLTCDC